VVGEDDEERPPKMADLARNKGKVVQPEAFDSED
jgi:hypothetical protein